MFKSHKLNFERMEELFANPGSLAPSCSSVNGSAGTKGRELPAPEGSSCERKPKKIDEVCQIYCYDDDDDDVDDDDDDDDDDGDDDDDNNRFDR